MFSSFSSIEQFRNVIKRVKDFWNVTGVDSEGKKIYTPRALPKVKFLGTVKLHGQNTGIVFKNEEIYFQSRNQTLDKNNPSDQNGFVGFALKLLEQPEFLEKIEKLKKELSPWMNDSSSVIVYGEWAGSGIQKGVALTQLEKMFVIFKVKVTNAKDEHTLSDEENSKWFPLENLQTNLSAPSLKVYTTLDFPTFEVEINFEQPEYAQNEFVKLTQNVEQECPVGKYFNVSGIGEGIVWSPHGSESEFIKKLGYSRTTFKTKGEKHSVTKVKTIASVDIEKIESLNQFIENTCTEQRLNQGVDVLKELNKPVDMTSIPDFLRWIFNDIVKEEKDTMEENKIEPKSLGAPLSKKAREWYVSKVKANDSAN